MLAYGSNANPGKLAHMSVAVSFPLPAVFISCRVSGFAAVWCHGVRVRDGLPPATLTAVAGHEEDHFLALCTGQQIAALDRWEGEGQRYRRVRLPDGAVTSDAPGVQRPQVYLGLPPHRTPLLGRDGLPLLVARVPQGHATARLTKVAGSPRRPSSTGSMSPV